MPHLGLQAAEGLGKNSRILGGLQRVLIRHRLPRRLRGHLWRPCLAADLTRCEDPLKGRRDMWRRFAHLRTAAEAVGSGGCRRQWHWRDRAEAGFEMRRRALQQRASFLPPRLIPSGRMIPSAQCSWRNRREQAHRHSRSSASRRSRPINPSTRRLIIVAPRPCRIVRLIRNGSRCRRRCRRKLHTTRSAILSPHRRPTIRKGAR